MTLISPSPASPAIVAKVSAPSKGRVVEFTAHVGFDTAERVSYAGLVVGVHANGVVDLVTFGPNSVYHNNGVPYDRNGGAMSWRYPLHVSDSLDVGDDGLVRQP